LDALDQRFHLEIEASHRGIGVAPDWSMSDADDLQKRVEEFADRFRFIQGRRDDDATPR
jgi:hypothetical protein